MPAVSAKHGHSSAIMPFPKRTCLEDSVSWIRKRAVLQAIRGTVEVTVHQSRIAQTTRSEKLRL